MRRPEDLIAEATGKAVRRLDPLSGGCIGEVYKVAYADGDTAVAKLGGADSGLAVEGRMLDDLARLSGLPVPAVRHAGDALLVMDYIEAGDAISPAAEEHAAELLAALHGVGADRFGYGYDTLIGGLAQPNKESADWIAFFRDRRLMHMAGAAHRAGRLNAGLAARIDDFAADLHRWLPADSRPGLIHGDMWGGNVLVKNGRIAGFVDPAIYCADPEIELAFTTLFATFGRAFFVRYGEIRPVAPGFFEERRDIYNLYPLLTHARLFGGHYAAQVDRTLSRFGY